MLKQKLLSLLLIATAAATASHSLAKQGATDAIPGTSNGATNTKSGGTKGGGGKSSTTTTTTTTTPAAPVQPLVTASVTFTADTVLNGVTPICSGSYHIDPYYPTLSLMTITVNVDSANLPDGSSLYLYVNGLGGTLYPFTSNVISVLGQKGSVSESIYITPGTTIDSILITDVSGKVILTGH